MDYIKKYDPTLTFEFENLQELIKYRDFIKQYISKGSSDVEVNK